MDKKGGQPLIAGVLVQIGFFVQTNLKRLFLLSFF